MDLSEQAKKELTNLLQENLVGSLTCSLTQEEINNLGVFLLTCLKTVLQSKHQVNKLTEEVEMSSV